MGRFRLLSVLNYKIRVSKENDTVRVLLF